MILIIFDVYLVNQFGKPFWLTIKKDGRTPILFRLTSIRGK